MHLPALRRRCGSAHCCELGFTFLIHEHAALLWVLSEAQSRRALMALCTEHDLFLFLFDNTLAVLLHTFLFYVSMVVAMSSQRVFPRVLDCGGCVSLLLQRLVLYCFCPLLAC